MHSLRPVRGNPRELFADLTDWLGRDAAALTVATSGTTGEPKQVCLSARALLSSATATLSRLGGPGHWLLALSPERIAGLQVLVRSVVAGRPPTLLTDHPDLRAAVRAMDGGPRYSALVPTQLHRMLAAGQDDALRAFDAVLVGGAAAGQVLLERAATAGVRVVTTYGMTETCGGCVYDGQPLDGVDVALDAERRIRLRGPVLFDGYLDRPDLTAQVMSEGWLVTGDLGRLDPDGLLHVLGRVDHVVVSGGVNVSASAVASRLRQHDLVGDVAVVGVEDPEWGERVTAFVVPAGEAEPALGELRDFVAAQLPRAWAPRDLVLVPQLPRLASGDLDVRALRDGMFGAR